MRKYFLLDAETDGLYGQTLSICAQIFDKSCKSLEPLDEFYGTIKITDEFFKLCENKKI
ncbi:MAG: hypothetical protein LUE12_07050 [Ruminococcus sp.]|nr:hypothetical protein [Ruminococcus sp.]